jgi:hypothetical protein
MPEYKLLAERNALDMVLYSYIKLLFKEQKPIINKYAREAQVQQVRRSDGGTRVQRKRQLR